MKQNKAPKQLAEANRYGSLADLPDEELADPDELERQVYIEMFAPVLRLPVKTKRGWLHPNIDDDGRIDWGAFATVDFDRLRPEFDRAWYKVDKLREELRDVLIMLSIVSERLPGKVKYVVLKYLSRGVIELEDIVQEDMIALGKLYLRARSIQRQIARIQDASRERRKARQKASWVSD